MARKKPVKQGKKHSGDKKTKLIKIIIPIYCGGRQYGFVFFFNFRRRINLVAYQAVPKTKDHWTGKCA